MLLTNPRHQMSASLIYVKNCDKRRDVLVYDNSARQLITILTRSSYAIRSMGHR